MKIFTFNKEREKEDNEEKFTPIVKKMPHESFDSLELRERTISFIVE